MNFSIRNLLIVIAIFSLVMGLAYGIGGGIGYAGSMVLLSVYVFPPFLWVAASSIRPDSSGLSSLA